MKYHDRSYIPKPELAPALEQRLILAALAGFTEWTIYGNPNIPAVWVSQDGKQWQSLDSAIRLAYTAQVDVEQPDPTAPT